MTQRQRGEQGSTLVLVAVFMVALMAFASLSIDVGNVLTQRRYIHEATDAAAIAAVPDWATGNTAGYVVSIGSAFAQTNGLSAAEIVSVTPGVWHASSQTFSENVSTFVPDSVPAVRVIGRRDVPTPFLRALTLGAQSVMSPRVESIAIAGKANKVIGALPWATCAVFDSDNKCAPITLQFFGVGNGTNDCSTGSGGNSGNFGQLDLSGGGNDYRENIINGYGGALKIGDIVQTDTGVSVGQTRQGLDDRLTPMPGPYLCDANSPPPDNKRLAIIPRVDNLDFSGAKPVTIIGFYVVSIDSISQGGKQVNARFVEAFVGTEVDPTLPPVVGDVNGIALAK